MTHLQRVLSSSSRSIVFLFIVLTSTFSLSAFSDSCKKVSRTIPGISLKVYEGLDRVQLLVNPNEEQRNKGHMVDLIKGQLELEKLEKRCLKADCNGMERSQIYAMAAYIDFQNQDTRAAVENYKNVLEQSPEIPIATELHNLWYVAQLEYTLENYSSTIEHLEQLVALSKKSCNEISPDVPHLHAMACYNRDKNNCALEKVNSAISIVEAKSTGSKIAEESWYNLQRQLYVEKEDFESATLVLEKMLLHFPRKQYYSALPQLYGVSERELEQMLAMDAAYVAGALTSEPELINLAKIYLMEDLPFSAAKLLEQAIDSQEIDANEENQNLLALAWRSAKEYKRAADTLRQFAYESEQGDYLSDLASIYLDLDQPQMSIEAGKHALSKSKFKGQRPGELHITMGAAYIDLGEYELAIKSFEQAAQYEKYHGFVQGWLSYAKSEHMRHSRLRASLADVGVDIDEIINN
jgi:tetratricopeptide (TPR) repeat protein